MKEKNLSNMFVDPEFIRLKRPKYRPNWIFYCEKDCVLVQASELSSDWGTFSVNRDGVLKLLEAVKNGDPRAKNAYIALTDGDIFRDQENCRLVAQKTIRQFWNTVRESEAREPSSGSNMGPFWVVDRHFNVLEKNGEKELPI